MVSSRSRYVNSEKQKISEPCRLSHLNSSHKKTESHSTDSLILTCKSIFSEYGLPKKIMSDAAGNFVSKN